MCQVHQPANVSKVREFVRKRVLVDSDDLVLQFTFVLWILWDDPDFCKAIWVGEFWFKGINLNMILFKGFSECQIGNNHQLAVWKRWFLPRISPLQGTCFEVDLDLCVHVCPRFILHHNQPFLLWDRLLFQLFEEDFETFNLSCSL